jgi:hypothetical protein
MPPRSQVNKALQASSRAPYGSYAQIVRATLKEERMRVTKGFSLSKWRETYDKVRELGTYLKLCSENNIQIGIAERESIENEISELLKSSMEYMDSVGMQMPKPVWVYDNKDEETWLSSDQFQYNHLLNKICCHQKAA